MTEVLRIIRFLIYGIPALILSLLINYLLVSHCKLDESVAYVLVQIFQVIFNFFICRWFVFKVQNTENRLLIQLFQFVTGIFLFRLVDWTLYTILVKYFGLYYLGIQLANVLLLSFLKFKFSQKVMER